jgi:hypothetical protein
MWSACSLAQTRCCRLAGASSLEAYDEWRTGDRSYLAEGSMAQLTPHQDQTSKGVANRRTSGARRQPREAPGLTRAAATLRCRHVSPGLC